MVGRGLVQVKMLPLKHFMYYATSTTISELENGAEFKSLEELLQLSDFVIATCALTEETKGLFDKKAFQAMKKSGIFINTSRGGNSAVFLVF